MPTTFISQPTAFDTPAVGGDPIIDVTNTGYPTFGTFINGPNTGSFFNSAVWRVFSPVVNATARVSCILSMSYSAQGSVSGPNQSCSYNLAWSPNNGTDWNTIVQLNNNFNTGGSPSVTLPKLQNLSLVRVRVIIVSTIDTILLEDFVSTSTGLAAIQITTILQDQFGPVGMM